MQKITIQPLEIAARESAAALFLQGFRGLRKTVPYLSADMEHANQVLSRLAQLQGGLAAYQDRALVGYLGWWLVDGFRNTSRRAGYVPEWAHAAVGPDATAVYQALYRDAAGIWFSSGCDVHAVTTLATDVQAEQFWFWNGFGKTVIDAVRPAESLNIGPNTAFTLRKANADDVSLLAEIEAEHWQHYAQPPTLMVPQMPDSVEAFASLLDNPENSAWLAMHGKTLAAYLRFESGSHGAAAVVSGKLAFACTGAYTRPIYRGKGAASALLDTALQEYAARGYTCATVDYESINPTASTFWNRYYRPVCYSLVRVPERLPVRSGF